MLQHRLDQGNSAIAAIDVIDDCNAVLAQVFSQALTSVMATASRHKHQAAPLAGSEWALHLPDLSQRQRVTRITIAMARQHRRSKHAIQRPGRDGSLAYNSR